MYYRDLLHKELEDNEFESPFFSQPWFNSLPLIICGPILRKGYYDSVSVWLAFKEEALPVNILLKKLSKTSLITVRQSLTRPLPDRPAFDNFSLPLKH